MLVCQKLTFGVLKTEAQIQAGQLMSFDDVFDVLSLCRFLVEDVEWWDYDDGFSFVFVWIVGSILVSLEVNSWLGGRWAWNTRIPLVESNPIGFPVRWYMKKCLDSEGQMESDFLGDYDSISWS